MGVVAESSTGQDTKDMETNIPLSRLIMAMRPNTKPAIRDSLLTILLAKWLNWNKLSRNTKSKKPNAKCSLPVRLLKFNVLRRTDPWPELFMTSSAISTAPRMDTNGTTAWKDSLKLLNLELELAPQDKLTHACL